MESFVWRLISALASNTLYYSPYRGFFKFPHSDDGQNKERRIKKKNMNERHVQRVIGAVGLLIQKVGIMQKTPLTNAPFQAIHFGGRNCFFSFL
jgi:hypothetical protein